MRVGVVAASAVLLAAGITVVGLAPSATGQSGPGWTSLFDGKSLDGWDQVGEANWRVEDAPSSPTRARAAISSPRAPTRIT